MIYQPRNVQPSGVSIDGLLDNTFSMEIQTNSYVSAYQLLIVDFNNNEVYTGSKVTLSNYLYNGDILEIPVSASSVALSNGTNYKWRVRLYQPNSDMLITYGLVQSTSTTTNIYLQPNINIKAGMTLTINSQSKTISSYNVDTGLAVVSSAFSSTPAIGAQYYIYSNFIETVPDYIVYARQTPSVSISNVPSSLTLKYHTFQGTYTQSDNVPIVYHQFDLYTRNDDGTTSLVASSDKVYSANLSYTYDSFRTGNKYLIQMTVENDMGVITTTDMYEFNVSYDIVEYLQQPLASFDDKNNAVKVSWVTPVENEATSFRSDAATGIIQDNNNTLTQATFEPGQSIGEGDVVQITNSDCELVIDGKSTQATRSGKNIFNKNSTFKANGATKEVLETGVRSKVTTAGIYRYFSVELGKSELLGKTITITRTITNSASNRGRLSLFFGNETSQDKKFIFSNSGSINIPNTFPEDCDRIWVVFYGNVAGTGNVGDYTDYTDLMITVGDTLQNYEDYGVMPSPDYPSEIESVGTYNEETGKYEIEVKNTGKNLLENGGVSNTSNGITFTVNDDKTILVNGNNDGTANSIFIINNYSLKAGTYILNGCPSGGSSTTYRLAIQKTSGWSVLALDTGSGSEQFTIDEATNIQVAIFIQKGQTISNLLFKPMIRLSSIIDDTYEPYKSVSSLFQLDQPLRSLPNGVKDELVIENGRAKIIKRIGNVVLDGSENWNNIQEATTSTDYYYAYTIVYDKLIGSKYTGISNNFIVKQDTYITASSTVDSDMLGVGGTGNGKIRMFIKKSRLTEMTTTELKTWLSTHNTQVDYELAKPQIIDLGDGVVPYIDGINYMHISSNMDTTFSLVYPHKTISGNAYDYTEFNPPGVKQTGTIKSYNAITGIGTLMPQYPFMYTPMQGDSYAVISNIYNVSGFSYLYNTPYNTVNSLYTHGYTATWTTPDGLCVLPDDFNITLQFSPDGNFFYDQNGVYQEVVNLITTETDDANNEGEFTIKIDKNKLIFVQNPDISLELPFYTNTTQVFVLSSASVAQINNDYVWDDTATWTDTYTWVEGGTSLERVCNHWWKVQITNTGIKIEEIFPTT